MVSYRFDGGVENDLIFRELNSTIFVLCSCPKANMPLPQLLVGKVAAITGGLTGIGRVRKPSEPSKI